MKGYRREEADPKMSLNNRKRNINLYQSVTREEGNESITAGKGGKIGRPRDGVGVNDRSGDLGR